MPHYGEENDAMMEVKLEMNPQLLDNDILYKNISGDTVALIMADHEIIPPREWMHDVNMKNAFEMSIKSLLLRNYLPVPHHWHDDDMTIFDKACYGIIPSI